MASSATGHSTPLSADEAVSAYAFIENSGGTPSLGQSFNMTSITDNAVGDFDLNYATTLSANHGVAGSAEEQLTGNNHIYMFSVDTYGTTADVIRTKRDDGNTDNNGDADIDFSIIAFGG